MMITRTIAGCFTVFLLVSAAAEAAPNRLTVKRLVAREARNMGIPVALALAVAEAESSFDSRALSVKGARGVMQIMPATAWDEYGIFPSQLWDTRTNVRLGLHFLGRLIKRYGGRTELALSYYNGGSRVGPPHRARVIPATRAYVRRVKALERRYHWNISRGQL